MTTVLWINKKTNIVDNTSLDDRPISEITLPDTHFALDLSSTRSIHYYKDESGNVQSSETIGEGGKGFTWDGTKLIGPQPKSL